MPQSVLPSGSSGLSVCCGRAPCQGGSGARSRRRGRWCCRPGQFLVLRRSALPMACTVPWGLSSPQGTSCGPPASCQVKPTPAELQNVTCDVHAVCTVQHLMFGGLGRLMMSCAHRPQLPLTWQYCRRPSVCAMQHCVQPAQQCHLEVLCEGSNLELRLLCVQVSSWGQAGVQQQWAPSWG